LTTAETLSRLMDPAIVSEVHHLCRSPRFQSDDGMWDEGWNCRLQAFISGVAVAANRIPTAVGHGRASFVVGPSAERHPGGYNVAPHAWLMVQGNGVFDVSPSFDKVSDPQLTMLREWRQALVVSNRVRPTGDFALVTSDAAYEDAVARATHTALKRSAIYQLWNVTEIGATALSDAMAIASGPIADELKTKYADDVLIAAGRHLYDLMHGRGKSLTSKPQPNAWEVLAKSKRDQRAWFLNRIKSIP
jgi:hypothetical protein